MEASLTPVSGGRDQREGMVGTNGGGICFLVRALAGGGAQRDAIQLANALAARGETVSIATLDANGPLRAQIAPEVMLHDLGHGRKRRMAAAVPTLRRFLIAQGPDVFVSSEASGNLLAIVVSRLLKRSRRLMIVLREVASPRQAMRDDPYVQNRIAYRLARFFYPAADRVLALTEAVRADLVQYFGVAPSRAIRMPSNAVMTEARLFDLAAIPRAPETDLIAAVGRLSPEKDFATLIEALAICRQHSPLRLEIAGEGPERGKLEALVARLGLDDAVTFSGFMSDPTILLARAALFVSSSRHEGFGNAIVEALACNVPVVSTDAPYGPREILEDDKWGVLVPVGDPRAMADAILAALRNPVAPDGPVRAADFTTERAASAFLVAIHDGDDTGA